MGIREPLDDWTVDRMGLCPVCIVKKLGAEELAKKGIPAETPPAEPEETE